MNITITVSPTAKENGYKAALKAAEVINEAIELAKLYGSDNAPRFINGVLDAIVKERK